VIDIRAQKALLGRLPRPTWGTLRPPERVPLPFGGQSAQMDDPAEWSFSENRLLSLITADGVGDAMNSIVGRRAPGVHRGAGSTVMFSRGSCRSRARRCGSTRATYREAFDGSPALKGRAHANRVAAGGESAGHRLSRPPHDRTPLQPLPPGVPGPGGWPDPPSVKQEFLAVMLGVTRPSVVGRGERRAEARLHQIRPWIGRDPGS